MQAKAIWLKWRIFLSAGSYQSVAKMAIIEA